MTRIVGAPPDTGLEATSVTWAILPSVCPKQQKAAIGSRRCLRTRDTGLQNQVYLRSIAGREATALAVHAAAPIDFSPAPCLTE